MDAVLAFLSPRKQPQSAPAPVIGDDVKPPIIRKNDYSRKDRKRAKRAQARFSSADTRSEAGDLDSSFFSSRSFSDPPDTSISISQPEEPSNPDFRTMLPFGLSRRSQPQDKQARKTPIKIKSPPEEIDAVPAAADSAAAVDSVAENDVADASTNGEPMDEDKRFALDSFLSHRWTDQNAIEIQVKWENGPPTWEPEHNLHRDVPSTLFAYWEKQGGHPQNPSNPDLYDVFAIRRHKPNKKHVLVEWVGYDAKSMTWEPTSVIEECAPEIISDYWKNLKPGRPGRPSKKAKKRD